MQGFEQIRGQAEERPRGKKKKKRSKDVNEITKYGLNKLVEAMSSG